MRTYSELIALPTLKERFEYLKLNGFVGDETFGSDRYLNQIFYKSPEWKSIREKVIIRDRGMELGLDGFPISGVIRIHHMNPLFEEDLINRDPKCVDLNQLISCSLLMHNAIHFGDSEIVNNYTYNDRYPNDTKLW